MDMLKGNFGQIVNKRTWGRHNSLIGNAIGHTLNIMGFVDGVSDMEGMVAVGGVFKDGRAFPRSVGFTIRLL